MRRKAGAAKQTAARKPRKRTTVGLSKPKTPASAVELASDASDYVTKLAQAIGKVNAAQERLVQEIDAASRKPELIKDPAWTDRSRSAAADVQEGGDELRVQPVPESMQAVDATLERAQDEAQLVALSQLAAISAANPQGMVKTLQHLDRMSQLIQQAYSQIRG